MPYCTGQNNPRRVVVVDEINEAPCRDLLVSYTCGTGEIQLSCGSHDHLK